MKKKNDAQQLYTKKKEKTKQKKKSPYEKTNILQYLSPSLLK